MPPSAKPASPTLEARRAQTFPVLAPDEIARMRRFGTQCRYLAGERVYETGKPTPGMLVVLSGTIRVTGRDGHGHDFPVVDHVAGAFSGELGQLSSRRSLVDAVAVGDVEALLISPEQLHALLIAEAALGEKVMRALILRRVALIETGTGGPVLIGPASLGDVARLGNFLRRNGIPHLLLDPASDLDAQAFIDRYARAPRIYRLWSALTDRCCAIPRKARLPNASACSIPPPARIAYTTSPSRAPALRDWLPRSTRPRRVCRC